LARNDTQAQSGERVARSDVILATETGDAKRIFLRQTGSLLGTYDSRVMISTAKQVGPDYVGYWSLYDASGRLLSRTAKRFRESRGIIEIGEPYRPHHSGGYYEFYVDRSGVTVSLWSEDGK
jgi:hypothetical protein